MILNTGVDIQRQHYNQAIPYSFCLFGISSYAKHRLISHVMIIWHEMKYNKFVYL